VNPLGLSSQLGALGRARGAAVVAPWWAGAIAAYQPKGAASLAASYTNLANPGTYNAALGVAPTWDALTGWTFNGTNQYLISGVMPQSQFWSYIIKYSDAVGDAGWIFGLDGGVGGPRFIGIQPRRFGNRVRFFNGGSADSSPQLVTGVLLIAGTKCFRDGVDSGLALAAWGGTAPTNSLTIGCINNPSGAPADFLAVKIQAFAIYSFTLTAQEVADVSAAMAAL